MRLTLISVLLVVLHVPAAAQVVYDNGPINGTTDAWMINEGQMVSDSFTVGGTGTNLTGLNFGAWLYPGDVLQAIQVVITSSEFGGTTYANEFVTLTPVCSTNQYGYNVCLESGNFRTVVNLAAGNYWITLENGCCSTGDPYYWDENSGPSSASANSVGTIPSESFTLFGIASSGTGSTTPEPGSILLFGTGVLGLAGVLRCRLR